MASASENTAAPVAGTTVPGPTKVTVRMYRHGLGDCFLLIFDSGGKTSRMLIDCGVIQGMTGDEEKKLFGEVLQDIIATTGSAAGGGRVDVLAVTHEHYDHVAGFTAAADFFVAGKGAPEAGKLKVGETWLSWAEDPQDELARRILQQRDEHVSHLTAVVAARRAQGASGPTESGIDGLLGFFGAAAGGGVGKTRKALDNARSFGDVVRYLKPGDPPLTLPDQPDIRIWVLGPPRDDQLLKRTDVASEVYHLAVDGAAAEAVFSAGSENDGFRPFDEAYGFPLAGLADPAVAAAALPVADAAFLSGHYFGPSDDVLNPEQAWRRIDDDWLGGAAEFAMKLDSATNNTSLVLAIEIVSSGKVMLFAADAQVGNWQSWQDLSWQVDGTQVTGPNLLRRTVLYKVGHHGSHNATLREKGLEMMSDDLVAFLPVDEKMAQQMRFGHMPQPGLVQRLAEKTGDRVIRMDEPYPQKLGTANFPKSKIRPDEALYYEWSAVLGS